MNTNVALCVLDLQTCNWVKKHKKAACKIFIYHHFFLNICRYTDDTNISMINTYEQIILTNWNRTDCTTFLFEIRHHLIILYVSFCASLIPKLPSFASPFLHFEVPKKLLQEQGSRPPVYSPPPSAHDPNIVGDSPPEGSSVKSPNTVPGKDMSFFTLTYTLAHTHSLPCRAGNNKQSQGLPSIKRKSNSGLESGHICMYVCIFKLTRVQLFPYVC